ncbi:MAG: hypothetical protein JJU18_01000 [Oceanicaulis sp.]|nr:hypothetical protein [Oceanicaulis sp.]
MNAAADRTVRAGTQADAETATTRPGPAARADDWSGSLVEARIEMIKAHHQAAAAATSIRAASDMVGEILDVTA